MKKIFSLLAAFALVLTLAACDTEIQYVEVEVPVEVEKIVREYVEVPVPEYITEYVDVIVEIEVPVEVPGNVENTRFYKPGVYFTNTEIGTDGSYTYAVVIVDTYGKIAGVMFDDTKTTSEFLIDEDDQLYVYVEGDGKTVPNTYRAIDTNAPVYPTAADAITADDLVVGIHTAKIATLTAIDANETSRILGAAWIAESDKLVEVIIKDQTTYGILTATDGEEVTSVNVTTKLTNVDVLLGLVQGILDNEAALDETVTLATTPVKGLYTPGYEFGQTGRLVDGNVFYNTAFVAVDTYGRIAGVYNDVTVAAKVAGGNATKWILGDDYGMAVTGSPEWFLQSKAFGEAVVKNQGTVGFELFGSKEYAVAYDSSEDKHAYTNQIAGATIGIEKFITATDNAIELLNGWSLIPGTYFVTEGENLMYVTIDADNEIEDIVLDTVVGTEQATITIDGDVYPLFTYTAQWMHAEELQELVVLVYKDDAEYRTVNAVDEDATGGPTYNANKVVDFTTDADNEIDEAATLEVVAGNYTNHILNDGNQTFAADFIGEKSPYIINLDGETANVDVYQQMLVEALLQAIDSETVKYAADVDVAEDPVVKLANGTYFASLTANTDGEQFIAYMVVAGNAIQNIIFDATTVVDGNLTTKAALLDAEYVAKDEEEDGTDDWYEVAPLEAAAILGAQTAIIADVETGFNYTVDGDYTTYYTVGTTYEQLTQALIEQALLARVQEVADNYAETLIYNFDGESILEVGHAAYTNNLIGVLPIDNAGLYIFSINYDEINDDVVEFDTSKNILPSDDLEANAEAELVYTLEYDNVEYVYTVNYEVHTVASLLKDELNDIEDVDGLVAVEGFDLNLDPTSGLVWYVGDSETAMVTENVSALAAGEHTLTAEITYDVDKTVTREFTVTIVSEEDAEEEVLAAIAPSNILNNGEVTNGFFELDLTTSIKGLTVVWSVEEDLAGVASLNGATDELTITRNYGTAKVVLKATILGGSGTAERLFEFRAVPADTNLVTERLNNVLDLVDTLGVKYVDTNNAFALDLNGVVKAADFLNDTVLVEWSLNDGASATIGAINPNELTVSAITGEETVEVTATFTVTIDEDTEVEITKEFSLIIFG